MAIAVVEHVPTEVGTSNDSTARGHLCHFVCMWLYREKIATRSAAAAAGMGECLHARLRPPKNNILAQDIFSLGTHSSSHLLISGAPRAVPGGSESRGGGACEWQVPSAKITSEPAGHA